MFDHKIEYGSVPPLGKMVIEPLLSPKHKLLVTLVTCIVNVDGAVNEIVPVVSQSLKSLTVTVYVPAFSPLISSDVSPAFDQTNV